MSPADSILDATPSIASLSVDVEKGFSIDQEVAQVLAVDWEGEDDPENPLNWKPRRKWLALLMVALMCFLSPLASTLLAPAAPVIARDFGTNDQGIIALIVSIFVLGYAVGPLVASPLSEIYGRTIVLQSFMIVFFIFNIACALAQSTTQMIVFRFLAGCGGAAPISIGAGTVTDCFRQNERGHAMAFFTLGILVGPMVGPVAGAWLVAGADWRWALWMIVIMSGMLSILSFFLLRETYHPALLARKAKRLSRETGDVNIRTVHQVINVGRTPIVVLKENLRRPFIMLFTDPICTLIGAYMAICVSCCFSGYLYLMFVTFGGLFTTVYNQPIGIANLNYIAPGLGFLLGTIACGLTMDRIYLYLAKKNGGVGKPEYRIPLMALAAILLPVGLLIYGWTGQYQAHWIFPDIGIFIFTAGVIISFLTLNTYIADSFTYTASAIAATTVLRSIAGALFPLFAKDVFDSLGLGWGNSLLALIALALGSTYPVFLWYYGPRLRARAKE